MHFCEGSYRVSTSRLFGPPPRHFGPPAIIAGHTAARTALPAANGFEWSPELNPYHVIRIRTCQTARAIMIGRRQQAVIAPPVSQIAHGNQYTGGKRQGAIGTLKHIVINAAQPIGVLSVLCMQIMSACALLRIGRVTSVQSCTDLGA